MLKLIALDVMPGKHSDAWQNLSEPGQKEPAVKNKTQHNKGKPQAL
jgi:hypothetical protein